MPIYPVKHVSWSEVEDWSMRLAEKIASSGFKPDVVVAVGRGGYIVSRLLCDYIDVDKLIAVPIKWSEKEKREGENYLADLIRCFMTREVDSCIANVVRNLSITIPVEIQTDLKNMKSLAVEEVTATGLHLAKVKQILLEWGSSEVKTATLVWKAQTSTLKPDYTFIEPKRFVWFQFPWSRISDYQQFVKILVDEYKKQEIQSVDIDKLVHDIKNFYGFKPSTIHLKKALRNLEKHGIIKVLDNKILLMKGCN